MEIGDRVKIIDGSFAKRVDEYETHSHIGLCKDVFEVVSFTHDSIVTEHSKIPVHDVVIRNTDNLKMYLHSKCMLKVLVPYAKELTMADLERKFGCKIKIVK